MDQLIPAAMAGTTRRNAQFSGDLFDGLEPEAEPEQQLLRAAALVGITGLAGRMSAAGEAIAADPAQDTRPLAPSRSLRRMLDGDFSDLLGEWLELVQAAGRRPEESLLPELLEAGRRDRSIRSSLGTVGGSRALWLARHNNDWSYLLGEEQSDESVWETGQSVARMAWFAHFRQHNPEQALELLLKTWAKESADERQKCLQTFSSGLSLHDEPFLESCLDDRSKTVRQQAAALLSQLPGSRLMERARARTAQWIHEKWTSNFFGLRQSCKLEILPPDQCTVEMQRDGIEPKSPRRDLGEKAWWLQQSLAQTPLDLWRATPQELVKAAVAGDWAEPMMRGWLSASVAQKHLVWAEALLQAGVRDPELFAILPAQRQEEILMQTMQDDWILRLDKAAYSRRLSAAIVSHLQKKTLRDFDWSLSNLLAEVARRLPPNTPVEEGWSAETLARNPVEKFISSVKFRQAMHQEISL